MAEPSVGAHIDDPGGMKDATQHVVGHLDPKSKRSYAAASKANHAAHGLAAQVNAELRKAVGVKAEAGDYGTEFYKSIAGDPELCKAYFDCLHRLLKTSRDWENAVSWWLKQNEVVRQAFKLYLKQRPSRKGHKPGSKTRWDGSTAGFRTRNTREEQEQTKQPLAFEHIAPHVKILRMTSELSRVKWGDVHGACNDLSPLNRNDRERVFKAIETVLLDPETSAAKRNAFVKYFRGDPRTPKTRFRAYIEKSPTLSAEQKQMFLHLFFT